MAKDDRLDIVWNRLGQGGQNLPPRTQGITRVQLPQAFCVVSTEAGTAGTKFTLSWHVATDPYTTSQVDTYNIYTRLNDGPAALMTSGQPPCQVIIPTAAYPQQVVFICQPVLRNGWRVPVEICPTATAVAY